MAEPLRVGELLGEGALRVAEELVGDRDQPRRTPGIPRLAVPKGNCPKLTPSCPARSIRHLPAKP